MRITLLIIILSSLALGQPFIDINASLTGVAASSVDWGDYDNDGDLDLLLTGLRSGGYYSKIYRNDGSDTFTDINASLTGVSRSFSSWGDYDNDGDLDILLTGAIDNSDTKVSKIYRNDGNDSFVELTDVSLTGIWFGSAAWGDYDNDDDLDIILTGRSDGGSFTLIYRNNGSDSFSAMYGIELTQLQDGSVAWGDYDNDGDLDLIITGYEGGSRRCKIYRNDGNDSFNTAALLTGAVSYGNSVAWGDYDSDGDLDVLLAGNSGGGNYTKVYRNDGNDSFVDIGASLTGLTNSSVDWGDYDNDGDLDILLTGGTSGNCAYISKIYQNDGSETFTDSGISLTGLDDSSAAWGDYDGDGDLDFVMTGYHCNNQYISKIYRNDLPDTFSPTMTINSTESSPTNSTSIPITVTFNESVTGFDAGDVTLGNGSISDFAGSGTTYTFNVTPEADGLVTIDIAAGVCTDAANNENTAASQFSITYDGTGPTMTITAAEGSDGFTSNDAALSLTFESSEATTSFTVGDISVINGSLSSFNQTSSTVYTATFTPSSDGAVTINVAADTFTDAVGNENTAATEFNWTYRRTNINVPADYSTIQAAIDYSEDGDTVSVAAGTYGENINFNGKNIVLGSLYLTTSDTSYISTTIIDGSNSGATPTIQNTGDDVEINISGFTIRNSQKKALLLHDYGTIKHCKFIDNGISGEWGAISVDYNITLEDCDFRGNIGRYAIAAGGSDDKWTKFIRCRFFENEAYGESAILYCENKVVVENCLFYNNTGDAIDIGMNGTDSSALVINTTIVKNDGYGIQFPTWSGSYWSGIKNCIIAHNTQGDINFYDTINGSIIEFYNNIIPNGIDGILIPIFFDITYENNISGNPIFVDLENGDYHLSDYSPAIGAGTATGSPTTDIEGNPRPDPVGSNPDMGAYENALGSHLHNSSINVATTGNDSASVGLSTAPFATIQAAIDYSEDGDTISVAAGTYVENITSNSKEVIIIGEGIDQTIADGGENGKVFYIDSDIELSGFTITNGKHSDVGTGMNIWQSNPIIKDCKFINNMNGHLALGGGENAQFINCQFLEQKDEFWPINSDNGTRGGDFINCVIDANGLGNAFISNSYPSIYNCTIFNYTDFAYNCGGPSTVNIVNSIFSPTSGFPDATIADHTEIEGNAHIVIDYCIFPELENSYSYGSASITYGDHNINADPLFSDLDNGNYSLSDYSPCIGSGTLDGAPTTDIEGNPRPNPVGSNPDMGAYENALGTQIHNSSINVATTGNDSASVGLSTAPFTTIQAAIDYSEDGDTVSVAAGTYVENIVISDKEIYLSSQSGSNLTVIKPLQVNTNTLSISNNNSEISGFTFTGSGNGASSIVVNTGDPLIEQCIFHNNESNNSIKFSNTNVVVNNILFYNYEGGGDHAIFWDNNSNPIINNSTIVNYGGGTIFNGGSSVNNVIITFNNCILQGNPYEGPYEINYSIVSPTATGSTNLNVYPLFVDAANGDYRLSDYSPAIGAGTLDGAPDTDIEGNPRPNPADSNPDMGAYENERSEPLPHNTLIYVSPDGNDNTVGLEASPFATIQAAIDYSFIGDTISVAAGTYTENINYNGKNIVVQGADRETTIIDGNQNGSVVTFENGEDDTTLLEGFTLLNGYDEFGGGIHCNNNSNPMLSNLIVKENTATSTGGGIRCYTQSSPTIENIIIEDNTASNGGGMYLHYNSNPSLNNVTISGNSAVLGGGMNLIISSPTLTNVIFSGNTTDEGGGMYLHSSSNPTLTNVTFNGNSAAVLGGGMCLWASSNPTLTNVTFSSNTALSGGGMNLYESSSTLTNVTFSGNTAADFGGGMKLFSSSPTLTNVTFSDNTAKDGGGMKLDSSSPTLTNVTITGNSADVDGGGMNLYQSSSILTNVTISGNTADRGGGMYINSDNTAHSGITTLTNSILWGNSAEEIYWSYTATPVPITINYSDIQGGEDGIVTNGNGTVNWGEGNIDANPLFVDAANGDHRLSDYSPAIGAGTATGSPTTDIEGNPRPNPVGSNPDMGAYENALGIPLYGGPVYHVSTTGDDTGTGSEVYPFATIQKGIDTSSDGDTVMVAAGTYTENINFNGKNIALIGEDRETTIIDGGQNGSVVIFESGETNEAQLIHFTISGGIGSEFSESYGERMGGGILLLNGSAPIISHCNISNNHTTTEESYTIGAGIASYLGGAAKIINCVISNNIGRQQVAVACTSQVSIEITNTVISNNISTNPSENQWSPSLISAFGLNISNSIIHNNDSPIIDIQYECGGDLNISYSNIEILNPGCSMSIIELFDPLFVDPDNGDYNLLWGSPCIDTGDPSDTDPDGTRADMGAYYYNQLEGCTDPTALNFNPNSGVDDGSCEYYEGPVWYVNTQGSDVDGVGFGMESAPFATIQKGIDAAPNGDTVYVYAGTYVENINFNGKNIAVIGEDRETTIIDGNQAGSVVKFVSGENSTTMLSGFTIKNGKVINGPGGGIKCSASSPRISNIYMINNTSNMDGGAIYCWNNSNPNFSNMIISQNSASNGGAIFSQGSNLVMNNIVITNNGGGQVIFIDSGSSAIINNLTSFGNNGITVYGGAGGIINIKNSVIWEDAVPIFEWDDDQCSITYSTLKSQVPSSTGNIGADPLFVDPDNGDFTLQFTSPCIDTGDPDLDGDGETWYVDTDDQDPDGTRLDMGAYPFDQIAFPITYGCMDSSADNYNPDANVDSGCTHDGPVYYVSTQGSDFFGIGTEQNPYLTIQKGIDTVSDGDTVMVIPGTYVENINYNGKNISVIGMNRENTIINSSQSGVSVVTFENGEGSTAMLSSFTIKGSTVSGDETLNGGGIRCVDDVNPVLKNLIITGNNATAGGGIWIHENSNPRIEDSIISNNSADGAGGGLRLFQCNPTMARVIISNNTAASSGGGIYCKYYSYPDLTNVTISRNSANNGDAIYLALNAAPTIQNSIIWGNHSNAIVTNSDSELFITYSDVEGGFEGEGNINSDPLFTDLDNDDYSLQWGSPAIDTGDPNSPLDLDGTVADMGAYFFNQNDPTPPTVSITSLSSNTVGTEDNLTINWEASDNWALDSAFIDLIYPSVTMRMDTVMAETGQSIIAIPDSIVGSATLQVTVWDFLHNEALDEDEIDIYDNTVPILAILTPTAGYSIPEYGDVTVTWAASDNIGVTQMGFYYSQDGYTFNLLGYVSSDASYTFNVGSGVTDNAKVKVIAEDTNDNTTEALSNEFSITDNTPPTVQITSPQSGDSFIIGKSESITWSESDNVGIDDEYGISSAWITAREFDWSTGSQWTDIVPDSTVGTTLWFQIPNAPTDNFSVRAIVSDAVGLSDTAIVSGIGVVIEYPVLQSYTPMDTYSPLTMDNIQLEFSVAMDPTTVSNISLSSALFGDIAYIVSGTTSSFNLALSQSMSSLDTLSLTLPVSLQSSYGYGFDGNADGTPGDSKAITLYLETLADYDHNEAVDFDDLTTFVTAWYADDYSKELGPFTGDVPHLIPEFDGAFTILDIAAFMLMWNWSHDFTARMARMAEIGTPPSFTIVDDILNLDLSVYEEDIAAVRIQLNTFHPIIHVISEGMEYEFDISLPRRWEKDNLFEWNFGNPQGRDIETIDICRFETELSYNQDMLIDYEIVSSNGATLSSGSTTVEYIPIPDDFALHQAYPNPFNPTTTIQFDLPEDINVLLEVYDISGRLVDMLHNSTMQAGYHSIIWDATMYSSGIYFVKLHAGSFHNTQKLMLVK